MRPIPLVRTMPRKSKAPPVEDRHPVFEGPLERWEMILDWHISTDKSPRIQRLGFKAPGDFTAAVAHAERLRTQINGLYGRTLGEIREAQFVRLIAVYAESAFKDYSAEKTYNKDMLNKAISQRVAEVKALPAPRPGANSKPPRMRIQ